MKFSLALFLAMASPAFGTMTCSDTASQNYQLVSSENAAVGALTVAELDYDQLKVCFDLEGHSDLTQTTDDDNSPTELVSVAISVGCNGVMTTTEANYPVGTYSDCKIIAKPDCPYESPIDVQVDADIEKLGGLEFMNDYFPKRVEYQNYYYGNGGAADSYFDIEFKDGPFAGFKIDSWCIDIDHVIGQRVYTGLAVSGYDPDLATLADNVDDPTRLSTATWMINNFKVGETYDVDYLGGANFDRTLCPKDFPNGPGIPADVGAKLSALGDGTAETITLDDATLQRALWYLVDNTQSQSGIAGYNDRLACYLAWAALQGEESNGAPFEPGCNELIPIVLVPDPETTIEQQTLVAQTTFASLKVPCDTITETVSLSGQFQMTCRPEIGAVVGDPHIYTFDGLLNDCQAAGEFVLFRTPGTTRQMHARFAHFTTAGFWSVTKAIAVQDLNDAPKVEFAVPVLDTSPVSGVIGSCPVIFYVNGVQQQLSAGSGDASVDVSLTADGKKAVIEYPATGLKVTVSTAYALGCMMNMAVEFPGIDATTRGLMGSPDGNPMNDWMTADGTAITVPTTTGARSSEEGYNYCTTNWCIIHEQHSLLTTETGVNFEDLNGCSLPFGGTIIGSLQDQASQEVLDFCGDDQQCLIDGVMGGLEAAKEAVAARAAIAQTCNALGGECGVASCCDGLGCDNIDGDKQCVEPRECPACLHGTSGPCINENNSVCYPLGSDGKCPSGTNMCHHINILQRIEALEANAAPATSECSGCWWGTSGHCQAANTVCYALDAQTGECPAGTDPCLARRRQLRGN